MNAQELISVLEVLGGEKTVYIEHGEEKDPTEISMVLVIKSDIVLLSKSPE